MSDETFGIVYTAKLSILTIPVCERRCLYLLDFVLEAHTLDYVPRYRNAVLDEHTVFGKSPKVIRSVGGFVFVAGTGRATCVSGGTHTLVYCLDFVIVGGFYDSNLCLS